MRSWFEFVIGVMIWCAVLRDGVAMVILPRSVLPMRRLFGRFYRWSWRLWAAAGLRIRDPQSRLSFVAAYGPISIVFVLVLWAGLMSVAFALIYHGLGPRFQAATESVGFGTLLYMSGSTFLTLGVGDVTSQDPFGRLFVILETGTGYLFLRLMITYMPVLHQAYGSREVKNFMIHSRTGYPPSAIKFLHRYFHTGRPEILRGMLREAERWLAETLQSHLSHPVLSFYRAQHKGESWLVSLTTILDARALLIAGGEGHPAAQARIIYRMGIRLLKDLTDALNLSVDPRCRVRLSAADLPALMEAVKGSGLPLSLGPGAAMQLLRIVRRYELYLAALSACLVIPLPSWTQHREAGRKKDGSEAPRVLPSPSPSPNIPQGGPAHSADRPMHKHPGVVET